MYFTVIRDRRLAQVASRTEMMWQVTVAWVMPVIVVKLVLSYLIKKRTERVRIKD
jgi:hypothetical protein